MQVQACVGDNFISLIGMFPFGLYVTTIYLFKYLSSLGASTLIVKVIKWKLYNIRRILGSTATGLVEE